MNELMDKRTASQRWADKITEFSGSWSFIGLFTIICLVWIISNISGVVHFDIYPFLFLNWILTIVSTFQNPLILLSQNRQNETDRENTREILRRLTELQKIVEEMNNGKINC